MNPIFNDTIIAVATPPGMGAIAVIRLSGPNAISSCDALFKPAKRTKTLLTQPSHTLHFGTLRDENKILDEVLVSVFKAPNSYTGENIIEISCHGSPYIQQEIVKLFIKNGVRLANPGEFTLRAFLNGKLDLSQAEAVADLIESNSSASHQLAMQQMRGGYSRDIEMLRHELLNFASLIELELDFSEEDVEFADRIQFNQLIDTIRKVLTQLIDSFAVGNALKNGIPIAIVGEPNVGKSTLLNALLKEEKAIVSEIAGTTRDAIEDDLIINGVLYRFIDTAGIRETKDTIESIGIKRTFEKIEQSQVIMYLVDASTFTTNTIKTLQTTLSKLKTQFPEKLILVVVNKIDLNRDFDKHTITADATLLISAKTGEGIHDLMEALTGFVKTGTLTSHDLIVTNSRHYEAFLHALEALNEVKKGLNNNISGDLLAIDIREALFHLGAVTGQITTDDLLANIFANFCIGK